MKTWLDSCDAVGGMTFYFAIFSIPYTVWTLNNIGGDLPEAVADGLQDTLKLSWREKSTKICVLISDGE